LAGKNTGKSFLLRNLEQRHPDRVLLVDLRTNTSNILVGLLNCLDEKKSMNYEKMKDFSLVGYAAKFITKFVSSIDHPTVGTIAEEAVNFARGLLASNEKEATVLSKLVNKLANSNKMHPFTVIIDEANLAFTIDDNSTEQNVKDAKEALMLFTGLTKQSRKVLFIDFFCKYFFSFSSFFYLYSVLCVNINILIKFLMINN
jgi:hypothetical protein